ncbi:MAG: amino acid permease [Acidobacteria bacterium]|nr:amino acid permease [Acidobacteriota bacterium]
MNLFRTKSITRIQEDAASGLGEHAHDGESGEGGGLRRTLGQFDLTLMGIAAIIGAGIFAMVGKASFDGGPGVIFLFTFTAVACAFSALCYAEFASRIPVAGSAYTYSYASLGEIIAWIIGWDLIVEYAIGNIAVAISWSDYFTGLLAGYGINLPEFFTMDFLTAKRGFAAVTEAIANGATLENLKMACDAKDAAINCAQFDAYTAWANAPTIGGIHLVMDLPALLITFVITTLVFIGIRESKWAGNAMTILKIGVILMVIFLGLFYVNPKNWSPFAPNGFAGIMKGVSAVFFAYIGFDALSTTAEECKDPHRDLPRAMIYSLVICTILYCSLALVLTGMVSYTKLNVGDPLAFVFGAEGANIPWVAGIIAISAVIALATVFLVFQIGQPRLWMAMSRDGLLPKRFSSIHPKFKTPWFSTIITGMVVAIPALFMNLTEVTDLASIGTLFAFVVVCAGVLFKDEEFGRENRFVPYISGQFVVPALLLVTLGLLYWFNPEGITGFFQIKPEGEETMFSAFSHKIPMIVFILLCGFIAALSIIKRLSLIPVLGLLLCTYLMTELGVTNWLRFAVWLLFGLSIYFGYGYVHSNLGAEDDRARKLNSNLMLASLGFFAAGLGLAFSAFTFVSDLVIYLFPTLDAATVSYLELGLFVIGLIGAIAGVTLERSRKTAEV